MKKISMFMSALALLAFASCEEKNGLGDEEFIEDGFYVVGEATGSDNIQSDYMMAAGFNEVTKSKRDGMYEKYVALEKGKTFSLAIYEAGETTLYGAELGDMNLEGLDNNPPMVIKRGSLQEGENAPKMTVAESGLYHIVLDLNKAKDLNTALIIVAPAKWGIRGKMNGWGYTEMTAPAFNAKKMTWTIKNVTNEIPDGYKFTYAHGWKVNMDDMGNVKAEIGLGNNADSDNLPLMENDLVQYGKNIQVKRGIWDIELTWNLKGGNLGKNFTAKMTKVGEVPFNDNVPEYKLGLIGAIAGTNWDTDLLFTYVSESNGTYKFEIAEQAIEADAQFKVRSAGTWDKHNLGYSNIKITGDADNFEDKGGNIGCKSAATYKITLTFNPSEWEWVLDFQKL